MIRDKKRYVRATVRAAAPLTPEDVKHAVYEALFEFLGQLGCARAATQFKAYDETTQTVVVKTNPLGLEDVIAALAAKRNFRGQPFRLHVTKVSGIASRVAGPKRAKPAPAKA